MSCIFFFRQKTAYEMRISDGSSDVCSSDLFGKAAIADAALGDRLAGAAAGVAIRHRARPDDRSRAQIARLRRMGDELAEVEGHVDARIGPAERLAVEIDAQRPVQLTVPPAIAAHLGEIGRGSCRERVGPYG